MANKKVGSNNIWFILGLLTLITSWFGYLFNGAGISMILGIVFGCVLLAKKEIGKGLAIVILNILFGLLGILITLGNI